MFRYILALSIICFCDADPIRIQGHYDQILLSLRSSVVSFFLQHGRWPSDVSSNAWMDNGNFWIIHGLWPINFDDDWPTYCKTSDGEWILYDHSLVEDGLKQRLRAIWPNLDSSIEEQKFYASEYHQYGSCIMSNYEDYFDAAERSAKHSNIGNVLAKSNIFPGSHYDLDVIIAAIVGHLEYDIRVICMHSEDYQEQYLLEVNICVNGGFELTACYFTNTNCNTNKQIFYAGL